MPWFWAFLFTQIVEIPIYMRGLRARMLEAFGATALTHPIVWFVIPEAFEWFYRAVFAHHASLQMTANTRYYVMVAIAETFAVVVEALYFRALFLEKPWRWAFIANMSSFGLGMLSRTAFGFP
jgi:hypothetical protein